ncbi:hypothetical protein X777_15737 [Ooceraea biroi]|uniref:Uncharacterized protein n=1 Tax=Ooceraea biroi TaxID=2015173 RepID=A0A026WTY4_OOCBI|nr:hypothetical protein X777_15737 [Ooceraea biroi]
MTIASTCTLCEYLLPTDEAAVNVAYIVVGSVILAVIVIGSFSPRELACPQIHSRNVTIG